PRPVRESGRVTTPTSSWGDSATARREGSAAPGVPAKTTRTSETQPAGRVRGDPDLRRARGAEPLRLADLLHRHLAQLGREPVDEQDAVEVVGLVLEGSCEQLAAL